MSERKAVKKSCSEHKVYSSSTALRQGRFSTRRKTVHREKNPTAFLKKRQSTLTQLDFCSLDAAEDVEGLFICDSEEEEEEASGEEIGGPRKRRKTSPVKSSTESSLQPRQRRKLTTPPTSSIASKQQTLTQMLPRILEDSENEATETRGKEYSQYKRRRSPILPESSSFLRQSTMTQKPRLLAISDSDDEDDEVQNMKSFCRNHSKLVSRPFDLIGAETQAQLGAIDLACRNEASSRKGNVDTPLQEGDLSAQYVAPRSAVALIGPHPFTRKTPKRSRVFEIPSSQSPPETPLTTRSSKSRAGFECSPVKMRSLSSLKFRALPTSPARENTSPGEHATSDQVSEHGGHDAGRNEFALSEPPIKGAIISLEPSWRSPLRERSENVQIVRESSTQRRVRQFNARMALFRRRPSSTQQSGRVNEVAQRKKVIRSSTGSASEDEEQDFAPVKTGARPQLDTQYAIGEETQAILGAIDLSSNASAEVVSSTSHVSDGGKNLPPASTGEISPFVEYDSILITPEAESLNLSRHSLPRGELGARLLEVRRETQVKDNRALSDENERDNRRLSVEEEREQDFDENFENEGRIPSSQNASRRRDSQVVRRDNDQETYVKEEPMYPSATKRSREIADSYSEQDEEELQERNEGNLDDQTLHTVGPYSLISPPQRLDAEAEHDSLDPASEQLLRENEVHSGSVPMNFEPLGLSKTTSHPAPSTQSPNQFRPSQATTMDETQLGACSALRTQRQIFDSPVRPTQTILVPSSPALLPMVMSSSSPPQPPASNSSSTSAKTPENLRIWSRNPVTMSQLIPESLREDESYPMPPNSTWDFEKDVEDDEL